MSESKPIMVKFSRSGDEETRKQEIKKCVGTDLVDSKPLFPDVDDDELSTLFEVHIKETSEAKPLVEKLQALDDVEYAHEPSDRAPI